MGSEDLVGGLVDLEVGVGNRGVMLGDNVFEGLGEEIGGNGSNVGLVEIVDCLSVGLIFEIGKVREV